MIPVLGGLADDERDLIRTRTAEGRSQVQKRGQHMSRPGHQTAARHRRAEGATLVLGSKQIIHVRSARYRARSGM
jgi:DNA invertase Pin-like site-specific DNA recombinase